MASRSFPGYILAFALFLAAGALAAQEASKDGDVSEALKVKYSPLIDAYTASMDAGKFDQALKQILAIRASLDKEKEMNPVHVVIIQINVMVAQTYVKLAKYKEAEAIFTDIMARMNKAKMGESEPMVFVLKNQFELYRASGNEAKAKDAEAKAAAMIAKHPDWAMRDEGGGGEGDEAFKKYKPQFEQIYRLRDGGDMDGALALASRVSADVETEFGVANPATVEAGRILAQILMDRGEFQEAEVLLERLSAVPADGREAVSMERVYLLQTLRNLYRGGSEDSKVADVERKIEDILSKRPDFRKQYDEDQRKQTEEEARKRLEQKDNPEFGKSPGGEKENSFYEAMGGIEQVFKSGKRDDAKRKLEDLLAKARSALPPDSRFLADADETMARYIRESGDADKAAQPMQDNGPGPDAGSEVRGYFDKANDLRSQGKKSEAEKVIRSMLDDMGKKYGDKSRPYALALLNEAFYYSPEPKPKADLKGLYIEAAAIFESSGDSTREYVEALTGLGRIYFRQDKDYARAEPLFAKASAILESMGPDGGAQYVLSDLGSLLLAAGKDLARAEKTLRRAIELDAGRERIDEPWLSSVLPDLGQACFLQGRYADAERAYKDAELVFPKAEKAYADFHADYRLLYTRMVALYEKTGNKTAAKTYKDMLKKY